MSAARDDEFKLRFPVAKDRTLRRIAIAQLSIYLMALSSVAIFLLSATIDYYISGGQRDAPASMATVVCAIAGIVFAFSFPAAWIVAIIEARVQVRRYGWRAVSDPIEAQRVAMREALYDVATGSTRPDVDLDRDGDRIMVVPVRRLRPVGARLELIAERQRAHEPHQGS
ncbi:MAG: hypothetical protein AB7I59_01800 [Geminicoccaceae bacterium]